MPGVSQAAPGQKSFCESGFATALSIGAGGAQWLQSWGAPADDWLDCDAAPNIGLLNKDTTGVLTTTTTGPADIPPTLIAALPFQGQIVLVAPEDEDPEAIAGEIHGQMTGEFVVDLNAARATITEETITVRFGSPLHAGPDGVIQVTATTGKFKSVQAVGDWNWHVNGTITIMRVPGLDPQTNIFAALQNSALILSAVEEVVLSGSYVRVNPMP